MRAEILDEVERLNWLVIGIHKDLMHGSDMECACGLMLDAGCRACEYEGWVWGDEEQNWTATCQCVTDAHSAHVAAILAGTS